VRLRLLVRTVSELCITAGAVIVLFVVYVLFWTGVRADTSMDHEISRLQDQWAGLPISTATATATPTATPTATATATATAPQQPAYRDGTAFAVMYIPRLGRDWHKPVLQGTGTGTLKKGLGHYAATARLGATGNFAVAGHRRTYGDPFKDFPALRKGDKVVLTDGTTWYTYEIDRGPYKTLPSDIGVIDPVPIKSGFTAPGRYLTLTTCEPEWGHSHRLIAWGHLAATQPVEDGMPDSLSG
jgi:sortase A